MDIQSKIEIALLICTLTTFFIIFVKQLRRRSYIQSLRFLCYLHVESKPQCWFKNVVADNSYSPFKHLKLNGSDDDKYSNLHPYEAEITALLETPQLDVDFVNGNTDLKLCDSFVWVDTEDKLKELADLLSKEGVFGVDTEQHSLRSFLGFTALIQISSGKEDYLVDTIALHDVMGILGPVFSDPKIMKVFHGADNDVVWLQRDFHIYVVNMFDTAKACDLLLKPQRSLAYLLETYCGVTRNKILQRQDWRQRPLPLEMVQYARIDAHYLLYMAHSLITELKQHNNENSSCLDETSSLLLEAIRRSNMSCLQLYTKDEQVCPGESAAASIFSRHLTGQGSLPKTNDNQFQDLVRQLCAWRDLMARIHDENLKYVLSDQSMVALADKAPTTPQEIFSIISQADLSVQTPCPVVFNHVDDLCYFFQNKISNMDDIFEANLEKHLGSNGTCPLSIYNYLLLSKLKTEQFSRKASRDLFVEKLSCKSPRG